MPNIVINVEPLAADVFRPFGDVIQTNRSYHYSVNKGTSERYHDLAKIDVLEQNGRPLLSIFRTQPAPMPLKISMLERHPLSSQSFIPLTRAHFLVVVAPPGDSVSVQSVRTFLTNGHQGINYRRGIWHHPILALRTETDFLVIDRGGEGANCDEIKIEPPCLIDLPDLDSDDFEILSCPHERTLPR